jgi:hypothetical protein
MSEAAVFPSREALLEGVQAVLATYAGTPITARQCYYRLVAAGIIPNNTRAYKNLIAALTKWRREGTVPIEAFEDRTRGMTLLDRGWREDDPMGWARAWLNEGLKQARAYSLSRWYKQPERVVVAVEKQALEGPFTEVCTERGVDLAVCRGYPSISFLREVAERMKDEDVADGRTLWLLYFGDHDPSGQDIPRSVREDLEGLFSVQLEYHRVALNPDQVEEMSLIPAPVKLTDSRAGSFVAEHGEDVYELDAIDPHALQNIIREAIDEHFDDDVFEEQQNAIENGRELIEAQLKKGGIDKLLKQFDAKDG